MSKKNLHSSFRIYKKDDVYSIIKVFYNSKGKIESYTDIVIPIANNEKNLKMCLSSMLKACRSSILTDEDLK